VLLFFCCTQWARTHRRKSGETQNVHDTVDERRDSRNAGADYTTFESLQRRSRQTEQLTLEKKTVEDEKAEIRKNYEKKLKQLNLDNESILQRQQAAEKQLALAAPETQKFRVHFENFQRDFQSMEVAINNLTDSGNTETSEKLRGALSKIIVGMAESLI